MEVTTREKWDRVSLTYDLMTRGEDWRQGEEKRRLFAKIRGKTLLLAVGTDNDLKYFLPGSDIVAIDISPRMIEKAEEDLLHPVRNRKRKSVEFLYERISHFAAIFFRRAFRKRVWHSGCCF
jgi:hypothetical protein